MSVSHEWQAAVLSMASLRWWKGRTPTERVRLICNSRLRRHVGTLHCEGDGLALLTQYFPHLRTSIVYLEQPIAPLITAFPAQLTTLDLCINRLYDDEEQFVTRFNAAVVAVAALERLDKLVLAVWTRRWSQSCSLAPLERAPSLRHFSLWMDEVVPSLLGDKTFAELRLLGHLETFECNQLSTQLLTRLLAPPHTLRWRKLGTFHKSGLTDSTGPLLANLPLTR